MEVLLLACLPTLAFFSSPVPSSLDELHLRGACIHIHLRFWYAALTTPSDFISLMDSISRWPATQQHTGSVSVETHAPQPRQTASTAETLLHSPLRNFSFSSHMHTHIWAGGRRRLSLVKGRDNVSNREPLRSVSAGREAAGRPPAANKDDKCPLSISHSTTVSED